MKKRNRFFRFEGILIFQFLRKKPFDRLLFIIHSVEKKINDRRRLIVCNRTYNEIRIFRIRLSDSVFYNEPKPLRIWSIKTQNFQFPQIRIVDFVYADVRIALMKPQRGSFCPFCRLFKIACRIKPFPKSRSLCIFKSLGSLTSTLLPWYNFIR